MNPLGHQVQPPLCVILYYANAVVLSHIIMVYVVTWFDIFRLKSKVIIIKLVELREYKGGNVGIMVVQHFVWDKNGWH